MDQNNKKTLNFNKSILIIIVGLLIAAGVFFFGNFNRNGNNQIIATAGEETITRAELNRQIAQLEASGFFQIPDINTAERSQFETMLAEQMIFEKLLRREASRQGFSASEMEIESQYQMLLSQLGGDESVLERELETAGITQTELRENIASQIVMSKYYNYLAEQNNITVTEEEIVEFFNEQVGDQEGVSLEMFTDQIREQLLQQKLQEPLNEILENLIAEFEVQILI